MADSIYYQPKHPLPPTPAQGEEPAPWGETNIVSTRRVRVDAEERVCGEAVFPSDVRLQGMLAAAILGSPHANARLKKIDVSKAASMPGVRAVICMNDPDVDYTWPYSREMGAKLFDPALPFEGEVVAAVAADTADQAWDAVRAIQAEYQVLPHLSDERKALDKDAPKVHPDGNLVSESNYERGDLDQGFERAHVVIERNYRTACELHTPLELHGCAARWDGDDLTIWESTQGVFIVQDRVAQVLGVPLSRVRVIGPYVGGGFGSKLQTSKYSIIASILARRTGRPVRLFVTREQTYLTMGNRPAANMFLKAGAMLDGTITAMEYTGLGASGAYPAGGASLLDWLVKDLYLCPNVRTTLRDVYMNAQPARAFRAPGYPQCSWAVEQMVDELAESIGMDPVEFRLKNVPSLSQGREGNPAYTTTGLAACLTKGAELFGWDEARKRTASQPADATRRRGVGVAAANWFIGGGIPPATVILKMLADGSLNLNMGASDIGTGTKTVMAMVAAEELGVTPESIQIEHADTGATQYTRASGGSKTVPTEAPTVRRAAIALKQELLRMASEDLDSDPDQLLFKGQIIEKRDGSASIKVTELSRLASQRVAVGVGYRGPNPRDKAICPFAAQFCEVEVNTLTGEVDIVRFVAVNESGRVVDTLTFNNQVIGGVTMGIGLGTTEARVLDQATGKLLNRNWHDYKLPTALDVPLEMIPQAVQAPDNEANIAGVKGLGEPVTVPTAGAIANAVYNAVSVRMTESPINPTTLVAKLAAQKKEG